jgi:hypothetical protein
VTGEVAWAEGGEPTSLSFTTFVKTGVAAGSISGIEIVADSGSYPGCVAGRSEIADCRFSGIWTEVSGA